MASATQILGYLSNHREDPLTINTGDQNPGEQPHRFDLPYGFVPIANSNVPFTAASFEAAVAQAPASKNPEEDTADESWAHLVSRLQAGDAAAMAELYEVFAKGIRFYLCRQVGTQELDDRVHDAFLIVVQSIKRGELRDPRRLMGFVRTVVRRMVAAQIDRDIQARRDTLEVDEGDRIADQRANPEKNFIMRQKVSFIRDILEKLGTRDREILRRFYVEEEHPEQICSDMNLSITQFRLLKSRAKARFGEEGRKKLQGEKVSEESVRTFG